MVKLVGLWEPGSWTHQVFFPLMLMVDVGHACHLAGSTESVLGASPPALIELPLCLVGWRPHGFYLLSAVVWLMSTIGNYSLFGSLVSHVSQREAWVGKPSLAE